MEEVDSDEDKEEVGGLFKVAKKTAKETRERKTLQNQRDCSVFHTENVQDWEADVDEVTLLLFCEEFHLWYS